MSEGECSEEALYADGRAALAYLRSRADVNQSHLVFYGWSLGAVVAIDLAAREFRPGVLVCESPFASGEALVQSGTLIDITKNGQVIFDNANEPKKFIRVQGAGHTTVPWTMGPDAYIRALVDFIALN